MFYDTLATSLTQILYFIYTFHTSLYLARHSALHRVLLTSSIFSMSGLLWQQEPQFAQPAMDRLFTVRKRLKQASLQILWTAPPRITSCLLCRRDDRRTAYVIPEMNPFTYKGVAYRGSEEEGCVHYFCTVIFRIKNFTGKSYFNKTGVLQEKLFVLINLYPSAQENILIHTIFN